MDSRMLAQVEKTYGDGIRHRGRGEFMMIMAPERPRIPLTDEVIKDMMHLTALAIEASVAEIEGVIAGGAAQLEQWLERILALPVTWKNAQMLNHHLNTVWHWSKNPDDIPISRETETLLLCARDGAALSVAHYAGYILARAGMSLERISQ